jgi:uncharacterized RDD family membrane protein YckC
MICHRCGKIFDERHLSCPGCGLDIPRHAATGSEKVEGLLPPSGHTVPRGSALYAGFWRRAAALLLDRIVLGSVNLVLCFFYLLFSGTDAESEAIRVMILGSAIFGFFLRWLYFTLMESSALQATLGKAAIGISVTDAEGGRISVVRANGRYWAKIISAIPLGFGYLMAGFTLRRQALHDLIAGTLVIRK